MASKMASIVNYDYHYLGISFLGFFPQNTSYRAKYIKKEKQLEI